MEPFEEFMRNGLRGYAPQVPDGCWESLSQQLELLHSAEALAGEAGGSSGEMAGESGGNPAGATVGESAGETVGTSGEMAGTIGTSGKFAAFWGGVTAKIAIGVVAVGALTAVGIRLFSSSGEENNRKGASAPVVSTTAGLDVNEEAVDSNVVNDESTTPVGTASAVNVGSTTLVGTSSVANVGSTNPVGTASVANVGSTTPVTTAEAAGGGAGTARTPLSSNPAHPSLTMTSSVSSPSTQSSTQSTTLSFAQSSAQQPANQSASQPAGQSTQQRPATQQPAQQQSTRQSDNPPASQPAQQQPVHPQPILRIPNVITPNGDNINDYLVVEGSENLVSTRMVIYNRQGKVVYEKRDYDNSWNAENLPDGSYFYWFTFEYEGHSFMRQGSVQVIR